MATIRKRGGKYQVQVRRKGFPLASRSFRVKADADEWARFMETRADRWELPTPLKDHDQYKVRDLLERYRQEVSSKKRSYNTEQYVVNGLLKQAFANLSLTEITTAKICDYRDARLKTVKAGTVRRDLAILKHAFDIALREWGLPIKENPLNKMAKLKPQAGRSRRLKEDEYTALQAATTGRGNRFLMPIIQFAIMTGMRRGEILRTHWQDIDFAAKTLHIPLTKNGHARTIPLSSAVFAVLDDLAKKKDNKERRIFPITDNSFQLAWQRLIKRTGIKDLHFHDLRHEAISRFFELGLSVPEVALISGHRDYRMLFRYTHLKPEDIAKKLSRLSGEDDQAPTGGVIPNALNVAAFKNKQGGWDITWRRRQAASQSAA